MKNLIISVLTLSVFGCNAQINLNQLDGSMSTDESTNLEILGGNGTNQLLIDSRDQDYLKIAVKSDELYVASLCICNERNEIAVLHASAALGQIKYMKEGGSWKTTHKFEWQLREVDMTNATIAKRKQYLKTNGWVANTMNMGNVGETEFIIAPSAFGEDLKIAIGLMTAENPENIIDIPANNSGDCADLKLVSGDPKSRYNFDMKNWITIKKSNPIFKE